MSKPRGYIELVLFIDAETSGLAYGSDDPVYEANGGRYQAVSWGLVVANAQTLKPIEKLYVEIKWDGESIWSKEAQKVHGLSPAYLEEHGMTEEEAVIEIAGLILKYWGTDGVVCLGGHNVATFDKFYLRDMLRRHGIEVKFGSKTIDTNAIGFATFETHNSDQLFEAVGLPPRDPAHHNALTDADNARKAVQIIRTMFKQCVDGE